MCRSGCTISTPRSRPIDTCFDGGHVTGDGGEVREIDEELGSRVRRDRRLIYYFWICSRAATIFQNGLQCLGLRASARAMIPMGSKAWD